MPKTNYIAIDPAGVSHTRRSDRVYTHTVVALPSKEHDMAVATSPDWHKGEAQSFRYFTEIAAGNDPYPRKSYLSLARGDSEERIAQDLEYCRLENEVRRADAQAKTAGIDEVQFCARAEAARVADVEKKEANGHYTRYMNLGWCGRLDLAQKLASKWCGTTCKPVILEAQQVAK